MKFFEDEYRKNGDIADKIDFGWDSARDPAGGAYSAPQTP